VSYEVRLAGVTIGRVEFTSVDEGMAVALGPFAPTQDYAGIRHVFRRYSDALPSAGQPTAAQLGALDAFSEERDSLELALVAQGGRVIPTGWIMIYDFLEEAGSLEGLECEVQLAEGPGSLS